MNEIFEMDEKKNFIKEHITEEECSYACDDIVFDCEHCGCFEDCYFESCERWDDEYVDSVAYGGYLTKEDFWEQI